MGNFDASGIVYKDSIEKMESDYAKLTSTISSLSGVGTTDQKSGLIGQLDIFGEMFDKNAKAMNVFIVGDSTTGQTQESSTVNMIQVPLCSCRDI